MKDLTFIWSKNERSALNRTLAFCLKADIKKDDTMELCAADAYRIFADGEFLCYGPERTAEGYARKGKIKFNKNVNVLVVEVAGYNTASYCKDLMQPYFACNVFSGENIFTSSDFECRLITDRIQKVERYSCQRNYIEVYKQSFDKSKFYKGNFDLYPLLETEKVLSPVVINGMGDNASYQRLKFELKTDKGEIEKLQIEPLPLWWEGDVESQLKDGFVRRDLEFNLKNFLSSVEKVTQKNYAMERAGTGFIKIKVSSKCGGKIFVIFDEYGVETQGETKLNFRRTKCNDFILWEIGAGEYALQSFEPYELKYLNIFCSNGLTVESAELIALENKDAELIKFSCNDEKISKIFEAGRNTFAQNALDIFMDCPGRERAGWLCDSYFTAISEQFFLGSNKIEKQFLENIIIADTDEIPENMIPMCFPSQHKGGGFIPNWAMWFVVELLSYYERTGDMELPLLAKNKVYRLFEYFSGFENEYELLENLKGWVFIEWSDANKPSFIEGVNFPSNIMYSKCLNDAGILCGDSALTEKAKRIKKTIEKLSFNGEFFVDNMVKTESGQFKRTENISETCQYYALFGDLIADKKFETKMCEEFGPQRKPDAYVNVVKSNAFIGNYLRLLWLIKSNKYEQVKKECVDYFALMAEKTGTLWEHDRPSASCNHGFAAIASYFLFCSIFGFSGFSFKDSKIILSESYDKTINAKIEMPTQDGSIIIKIQDGKRIVENK